MQEISVHGSNVEENNGSDRSYMSVLFHNKSMDSINHIQFINHFPVAKYLPDYCISIILYV